MLPADHSKTYELFISNHLVVKTNIGSNKGFVPDMKLDQTIQCSKKGSGGNIGQKSNKKIVTQWELAYYEIFSISNIFRNITNGVIDSRDTDLHHKFSGNLNLELDLRVIKIADYINSKTNPLIVSNETKLYNFSTISLKKLFVSMIAGKDYEKSIDRKDIQKWVYLIQFKK